jgi:uncharacterized protein YukE
VSDKMVTPLSEIGNDQFRVKTFKEFIDNWICMNGRRPDRIDLIEYCFNAGWSAALVNMAAKPVEKERDELKAEIERLKEYLDTERELRAEGDRLSSEMFYSKLYVMKQAEKYAQWQDQDLAAAEKLTEALENMSKALAEYRARCFPKVDK